MKKSTKFNRLILILALSLPILMLTGCQDTSGESAKTAVVDRKTPVVDKRPDEEILPTLQLVENGQSSKIVMRSQTSHYLNADKSALEIDLTSSNVAFCKNEHPDLADKEEELIITLKAKNAKSTLTKGDFAGNKDYEITAVRRNASGQTNLPAESFKSLKITDLNNAIVRGSLELGTDNLSISGEYFTAICH